MCVCVYVRVSRCGQVQCMSLTKEDFRSCMNEKKFQEVLEEVAYQRAAYREQRALHLEQKVTSLC